MIESVGKIDSLVEKLLGTFYTRLDSKRMAAEILKPGRNLALCVWWGAFEPFSGPCGPCWADSKLSPRLNSNNKATATLLSV